MTQPAIHQDLFRFWGTVSTIAPGKIGVSGLSHLASIGNEIAIPGTSGDAVGEIAAIDKETAIAISHAPSVPLKIGDRVCLRPSPSVAIGDHWLGQVINHRGEAVTGPPIKPQGATVPHALHAPSPDAHTRKGLGPRLKTGWMACDTLLPICRGQRLGLFAGSGVGKSTFLGALAGGVDADRIVVGLIGERSREVMEFATQTLPDSVRDKTIIVAATAGEPAGAKKRAAYCAMAAAEHFRDQGHHVLLLMDSVTRFAEAHRETALAAGEPPALHAFPPSTTRTIAELLERAGPGPSHAGDITAVFSVLVAGSDMEEPVADMMRGILDGHIILSRAIAERGRYPAIDLVRSVSRALPAAASAAENAMIRDARGLVATYEEIEPMVQAGLYQTGADARIDVAIDRHPELDAFLAQENPGSITDGFAALLSLLKPEA